MGRAAGGARAQCVALIDEATTHDGSTPVFFGLYFPHRAGASRAGRRGLGMAAAVGGAAQPHVVVAHAWCVAGHVNRGVVKQVGNADNLQIALRHQVVGTAVPLHLLRAQNVTHQEAVI